MVDEMLRDDCVTSSVAGPNCDGGEHLKEHVSVVPLRTMKDIVVRLQAAVTMVDANKLRHVKENSVQHTTVCLEMDRSHFEHLLQLWGTAGFIN
jgi:hypothetical protein